MECMLDILDKLELWFVSSVNQRLLRECSTGSAEIESIMSEVLTSIKEATLQIVFKIFKAGLYSVVCKKFVVFITFWAVEKLISLLSLLKIALYKTKQYS